jgi:hypothetical protein
MSLQEHPKEYSPEVLAAFEAAYNDLWHRLYANVTRNPKATRELEIEISLALTALVSDGITDPRELSRRAFEAIILKSNGNAPEHRD